MDPLRNFGFLIKEVSRRYVLRFEEQAKDLSLTLPSCKVLAYLVRNEGISQSRLAELTSIEPMAMVRLVDRMEAEGLLERRPDPADRRARCLYLTPKSGPALDEIWRLGDQVRAETFAGISQQDRDVFLAVLSRLNDNLGLLENPAVATKPATGKRPSTKLPGE